MGQTICGRVVALTFAGVLAAVIGCGGGGGGGSATVTGTGTNTTGTNTTGTNTTGTNTTGTNTTGTGTTGEALFVSDTLNNRVVRLNDIQGSLGWTELSTGVGMQGVAPNGVAVDASGNIYFTLFSQHRVARVNDITGVGFVTLGAVGTNEVQQITVVGTGTYQLQIGSDPSPETTVLTQASTAAQIEAAREALTSTSISDVQVQETAVGSKVFTVTFVGGPLSGTNVEQILAVNLTGGIAVTTSTVTHGSATSGSGTGQFNAPFAMDIDNSGRIYVVDQGNHRLVRMADITGASWTTLGGPAAGSGLGSFNTPSGIGINPAGTRAYVADRENHRIVEIDISGGSFTALSAFGSFGSGSGQFNRPSDVAVDSTGRIYITDAENKRVVRVDNMAGGNLVTFGTSGTGVNQFLLPASIAIDSTDRIFVADENGHRLVAFTNMSGAGWTTLGGPSAGAAQGQFNKPIGIAIR